MYHVEHGHLSSSHLLPHFDKTDLCMIDFQNVSSGDNH